jgi:aspartate-semialdehyde dehydrogenase
MIKVGIVGGTGYAGVELLRILSRHPGAHLTTITSRKEAGTPVICSRSCFVVWICDFPIPLRPICWAAM